MTSRFKRNNLPVKSNNKKKLVSKNGNGNGNGKLTANQKIFTDEWLIDRNGTRAYKVAYPGIKKDQSAAELASRLLSSNIKVKAYINAKLELMQERAEMDQDWVLERYKRLADYYIDDLFYDDGSMKPFSEIPKKTLYAIGGFKQSHKTITTQDKIIIEDRIKEFKLADKKGSLDSISRYLGMFAKDNEQKNRPGGSSVAVIGQTIQVNLIGD